MICRGFVVGIVISAWCLSPLEIAECSSDPRRGSEVAREFLSPDESEEDGPRLTFFDERITLAFLFELIYEYTDTEETDDKDSGSLYDIFLDTAEFDLNIKPYEGIHAKIVAGIESIGKHGDHAGGFLDEATLRLQYPGAPFYFVGGKRTQPFGVFEDRLISGPITEDLYEIVEVGGSVGWVPKSLGLDLAFTVYCGQDIIENLESEGTHDYAEDRRDEDDKFAYIASLQLNTFADLLFLSVFYNNEPGDGRRNQTLGGALTLSSWDFNLDVEHIAALTREYGENEEENLEKAWFVGLSFEPWEDFEIAARYEYLDDDNEQDQDEVVNYRWLAGFNYDLTDYTILSVEYRYTDYEKEAEGEAAGHQNELIIQLAFEF
jgi:hypothetical protein